MDDDGLSMRRRLLILSCLAVALIIALLLPSRTVSYNVPDPMPDVSRGTSEEFGVINHGTREPEVIPEVPVDSAVDTEIPIYEAEIERVLHAIAICESTDRHFLPDGSVIKNPNSSATGRYQIMASVWRSLGESMGINIDTEAGNKKMAYHILTEAQGLSAWKASAECLAKYNVFIK